VRGLKFAAEQADPAVALSWYSTILPNLVPLSCFQYPRSACVALCEPTFKKKVTQTRRLPPSREALCHQRNGAKGVGVGGGEQGEGEGGKDLVSSVFNILYC
jgi:hypothetical protein